MERMSKFKAVFAWLAVFAVALGSRALAEAPAIVSQLPADTQVYVVVPNLGDASQKAADIAAKLGVDAPEMRDPLGSFKREMNLQHGIDDNGALAIALTKLPLPGTPSENEEPDVLMFVPVTDFAAFVKNLGVDGPAAGGITEGELQGETVYAKPHGKHALISNKKAIVEGYAPPADNGLAKLAGSLGGGVVGASDAIVYVDMRKIAPVLQPMVQMGLEQAKLQMAAAGGAEAALAEWMINLYGGVINAFLRDAQAVTFGADMTTEGFGLSMAAQFKAGSPLAAQFAAAPAGALNLNRLPAKPFMFAMAADFSTLPMNEWIEGMVGGMPQDNAFAAAIRGSIDMMKLMNGKSQYAMYAPQIGGAGPPSLFNTVAVYESSDPKAAIAAYGQSVDKLNGVELGQGLKYQTAYRKNVMQVGGKEVDQISVRMAIPPELAGELGPAAMFLGQDMGGYLVASDNAMILSTGGDPVQLNQAIDAADGSGKLEAQTPGLAMVRGKLMPHRFMETYIGVGTIAQLANGFLQMFAPDMQIGVPANLPPVGMSMSVDSGGMGLKAYVPMPVVIAIKDAAEKFQGGGGPGVGGAGPIGPEPADDFVDSEHVMTLTDANFNAEAVQSDKVVLVDFWAVWCGPCKAQAPIVAEIAEANVDKVKVGKLDIDKNPKIADAYEIEAIPTLLILKDGKVVKKFVGLTSKANLEKAIKDATK